MQEKPTEVNMDQASECDTESDEEPEDDKNVREESSQEVAGNNRELNFLFMAPRTRWDVS